MNIDIYLCQHWQHWSVALSEEGNPQTHSGTLRELQQTHSGTLHKLQHYFWFQSTRLSTTICNCNSFQRHPEAARATNTQQTWRQEFLGSWSSTVERSSTRTAAAGTFLRFFQMIFENTSLWRLKRLVTLSTYRRCINECIYLSIYLSI